MNITIRKEGNSILTFKDFSSIEDRGEIAHIITELEVLKSELLILWEDYNEDGDIK